MTSKPQPRILVFEPQMNGHHGAYLRWIVRGGIERGCRIRLATLRQNQTHPAFLRLLDEYPSDFDATFLPDGAPCREIPANAIPLLVRDYRWRYFFQRCYRDEVRNGQEPSLVFIPYLDACLYSLALTGSPFGQTPWGGIAMRPSFHLRAAGVHLSRVKECLFRRLLKDPSLVRLYTIVEPLARHIENTAPRWASRSRYLPDPAGIPAGISRAEARRALGIPDSAPLMLVYGAISLRKGVDALLAAAKQPEFPADLHLLLAGQQDAGATALLAGATDHPLVREKRLHVINDYLDETLESQVFCAADMVWLGYRQHYGSSGVMVQAGHMGLPLIGCEDGLIGWTIRQHGLGIAVPVQQPGETARAIATFARTPPLRRRCGEAARHYYASHTPECFIQRLYEGLNPCIWSSP